MVHLKAEFEELPEYEKNLFLHAEPLDVARDLAGVQSCNEDQIFSYLVIREKALEQIETGRSYQDSDSMRETANEFRSAVNEALMEDSTEIRSLAVDAAVRFVDQVWLPDTERRRSPVEVLSLLESIVSTSAPRSDDSRLLMEFAQDGLLDMGGEEQSRRVVALAVKILLIWLKSVKT